MESASTDILLTGKKAEASSKVATNNPAPPDLKSARWIQTVAMPLAVKDEISMLSCSGRGTTDDEDKLLD